MKKIIFGIAVTTGFILTSCSNAQVSIKENIEERPSDKMINENLSDQDLIILTMKNLVEDIKRQQEELEKIKAQKSIQDGTIEKIKKINIQLEQKMKKLKDSLIMRDKIISQQFKNLINNQKILDKKIKELQEEIKSLKSEKRAKALKKTTSKNEGVVIKTSNIRSEPKMGNNIIGYAKKGDLVEIVEKRGNWLKIKYKDGEGFIHKNLVITQKKKI